MGGEGGAALTALVENFQLVLRCLSFVALTGILKFLSSFQGSQHDSPQFFIVCSLDV